MEYIKEVESEEQLTYLKNKCLKCKMVLLEKKNKHPLSNLNLFTKRQKDLFLRELNEMMATISDEELDKEFNDIVCDELLACGVDYTSFKVIDKAEPDHSVLYNPVELDAVKANPEKEEPIVGEEEVVSE